MSDDLISRQAAIDALKYAQHRFTVADEAGGMGTVKWSEDVIYFAAAERVLTDLPSAQPTQKNDSNVLEALDCVSRQAAIDALAYAELGCELEAIEALPSAQPEITDEQAIEHLQSTGWMQNHDREMYDMGLKKQLADDSGSYDSLLPFVQPEIIRCKDCKYRFVDGENVRFNVCELNHNKVQSDDWFCADGERRADETD